MITIDFETRSACDLFKAGSSTYSEHPTTQVMCLSWAFDEDDEPGLWHRAHPGVEESPRPEKLMRAIQAGAPLEAHNAGFERNIWRNALRREFPWFPRVHDDQWHCSAAKAASFALPRKLEFAAVALHLVEKKDDEGGRLMKKMSKPRKARKAEREAMEADGVDPASIILWWEEPDELERLWEYCRQDVRTERALSTGLRDLSPIEREFWLMDRRMNSRGVALDRELTETALEMASAAITDMNQELARMTDNVVPKGSSRAKLKAWVNDRGADIPDTKGITVDKALKREDLDDDTRRALEICKDVNRTSTAKYKQALKQVGSDGRVRDIMLYCGAERTKRWAGRLLQPHNFVRGYKNEMDEVCDDILANSLEQLKILWGNPMDVLAKATRGIMVSPPGRDLIVADFKAIEARVLLWLVGDEDGLDLFRQGKDVYVDLAQEIYKRLIDPDVDYVQRQVGKTGILGLGFGMGWPKFGGECVKNGVPQEDDFLKEIVRVYRKEKYPMVEQYWYSLEEAVIEAVRSGETVEHNRLTWGVRGRFLHCRLPSGGLLSYFRPKVKARQTYTFEATDLEGKERKVPVRVSGNAGWRPSAALFKADKYAVESDLQILNREPISTRTDDSLVYQGTDNTGKLRIEDTYGGKLTENVTQATARDLLAEAMLRADKTDEYDLLLSVHDELICEVDEDKGNLDEFNALVSILPDWAEGCPVEAEGWRGKRYKKG